MDPTAYVRRILLAITCTAFVYGTPEGVHAAESAAAAAPRKHGRKARSASKEAAPPASGAGGAPRGSAAEPEATADTTPSSADAGGDAPVKPEDATPKDASPPVGGPGTGEGPASGTAPPPEGTANEGGTAGEGGRERASGIDPALARELTAESEALRDEIFRSRARIAAAVGHLEPAKVDLQLRTNLPRFYTVENLVLTLDGAPIYVRDQGLDATGDPLTSFRASPGVHRLGVAMDLTARRNPEYRMSIAHTVTFEIRPERDARVRLVLRELGNLWRLGDRGRGTSRLLALVRVRSLRRKGPGRTRGRTATEKAAPTTGTGKRGTAKGAAKTP
ncbi:MAG: hypothetical protein D6705_00990 [Deltaproteobacteria bacterium]|nr:MAG: hypothetical protein D6705_00990 [Deltaproteobacteria bacterium]